MLGQHPFELSLQKANAVAQEAKLKLERLDPGLNEWTLATNVFGPGGDEDIVIRLDQLQRFLIEGSVFGEETSDILCQEVGFEVGVLLELGGAGGVHSLFVLCHIRRECSDSFVPVFRPQVGLLVEDEEVAQLLQAHRIDVFEQDRILPLEIISW